MTITAEDVRYIASLARLRVPEEDEQHLAEQMSSILDYIDKLEELDTSDVAPMSHVLDLFNVVRADGVQQRLSREEALRNAPEGDQAFFRVPKVIE